MVLGIYCAGGVGRELYDVASRNNNVNQRWEEILFVDDVREEKEFYHARVCRLDEFADSKNRIEFVIANGIPKNRAMIFKKLMENGYQMTTLVDMTAIVFPTVQLGKGAVVCPYSFIGSHAILGDNVLVDVSSTIGHDVKIGDHSFIGQGVHIGGRARLGEKTFLGIGAILRDRLQIGSHSIIGMGAVACRDIQDDVIAVGNPARIIGRNTEDKIFKEN